MLFATQVIPATERIIHFAHSTRTKNIIILPSALVLKTSSMRSGTLKISPRTGHAESYCHSARVKVTSWSAAITEVKPFSPFLAKSWDFNIKNLLWDFNINLLQHENSQQVKNYTNLMLACNCTQLITRPTRITNHSATLLHHIYAKNIKMPVQPGIVLSDLSDHLPTFVMIKSTCLSQKHSSITLRHNYKSLDRSTFLQK